MSETFKYEQDGAIATLTLNNPDVRNPLSDDVVEAMIAACSRINADNSVRCVILTGTGKAFSAGGNVKNMRDKVGFLGEGPVQIRNAYRNGIQNLPLAFHELEVPAIAAVNGAAVGAGFDLACMCDIRIAARSARFAESFVKLGIVPGDGGAWFLPRVIGRSRAAEMTYSGDMIDANTALDWGLVSRVVADDDLMATARELAGRIAANPPQALRLSKRLLRESEHSRLDGLLELSAAFQALSHHTRDHSEAMNAFFDKRPGAFTGE